MTAFGYTHNPRNTDLINNQFTKWLEEKTNVFVEVQSVNQSDFAVQLQLLMSSGDYPEVILKPNWTRSTLLAYAKEGIIMPLTDLIEKYGYYWKKAVEDTPELLTDVTMPDGQIYCLGRTNQWRYKTEVSVYYYQPYLDKLGLDIPETTEEFYNYLKLVKENDVNGNGDPNDEIPLAGSGVSTGDFVKGILNAFVPFSRSGDGNIETMYVENGTVTHVTFDEAFKEGIKYIHKLYKEGLIAKDAFTMDKDQLLSLGTNENHIVGSAFINHLTHITTFQDGVPGDWLNWTPGPPLKGPNGVQIAAAYLADNFYGAAWVQTDKTRDPEIAFRVGDFLFDYEATTRCFYGAEGVGWRYIEPGVGVGVTGMPATWEFNVGHDGKPRPESDANWGWIQAGPMNTSEKWHGERLVRDPDLNSEVKMYKSYQLQLPHIFPIENTLHRVIYDDEYQAEMADLVTSLNSLIREYIARFTTGDLDIDKDWDTFVDQVKKAGIDRAVEIAQIAYDKFYKSR